MQTDNNIEANHVGKKENIIRILYAFIKKKFSPGLFSF